MTTGKIYSNSLKKKHKRVLKNSKNLNKCIIEGLTLGESSCIQSGQTQTPVSISLAPIIRCLADIILL